MANQNNQQGNPLNPGQRNPDQRNPMQDPSQDRTQRRDQGNQQSDRPLSEDCLLYTSPSPRDATLSRMPSSA